MTARNTSKWLEEAKLRQDNKTWAKQSFRIAVRILREIRNQKESNGMTQKKLAEAMEVSPQYINKDNTKLTVDKGFLQHMAMITVGTTRGILHSKTDNTRFNKYHLPTINVARLISENRIFNFENSD